VLFEDDVSALVELVAGDLDVDLQGFAQDVAGFFGFGLDPVGFAEGGSWPSLNQTASPDKPVTKMVKLPMRSRGSGPDGDAVPGPGPRRRGGGRRTFGEGAPSAFCLRAP